MRLATARRFVGLVRPAHLGALLRLGPQPLSLSFCAPTHGVWATGVGVAGEGMGETSWLEAPAALPPGPWFGGWAFDAERAWPGFDSERWILPEVLAWWDGERAWVAAFGEEGLASVGSLEARLARVEEAASVSSKAPSFTRGAVAGRPEFKRLVEGAVASIASGRFSKVVVAREIELVASEPVNERALLKSLEMRNQESFTFLVRGRDGSAFVGSSPELLCSVKNGVVTADALAGTAEVSDGAALLTSDKNIREHREVIDGVTASLAPFAASIDVPAAPVLKRLPNVVHLHTPICATLRGGVEALDVAKALSPTPAVCGAPREPARAWLRANELFSRGWYAGAVGFTGPGGTVMSVALRSALVRGDHVSIFVGAGIVEGSTAESEWVETEQKARTLLTALGLEFSGPIVPGLSSAEARCE